MNKVFERKMYWTYEHGGGGGVKLLICKFDKKEWEVHAWFTTLATDRKT